MGKLDLRRVILASLEANEACCLDNPQERERVAAALLEDVLSAIQLWALGLIKGWRVGP